MKNHIFGLGIREGIIPISYFFSFPIKAKSPVISLYLSRSRPDGAPLIGGIGASVCPDRVLRIS
jgi:hypothetical protein